MLSAYLKRSVSHVLCRSFAQALKADDALAYVGEHVQPVRDAVRASIVDDSALYPSWCAEQ